MTKPKNDAMAEAVLLTVQQVAQRIQCSERHVYRLEERGQIPKAIRLGAAVRWSRQKIEDWIAADCPTLAV